VPACALGGPGPRSAATGCVESTDAAQDNKPRPKFKQLSPLKVAEIFAPNGSVPALIRHEGQIIVHHCSLNIAAILATAGEA
jgi:hypothetical protein